MDEFGDPKKEQELIDRMAVTSGAGGREGVALELERRIEAKAGILLSHISIMIAITGVLFAFEDIKPIRTAILGGELVLYLLLALVCIWLQREIPASQLSEALKQNTTKKITGSLTPSDRVLYDVALRKEWQFRLAQNVLIPLTVALAGTIVWTLFDFIIEPDWIGGADGWLKTHPTGGGK